MFVGGGCFVADESGEVDVIDVLVCAVFFVDDVFDHDAVGCCDLFEVADDYFGLGWDDFDVEAGFFFDFTEGCLDGVFVGVDVSAGWEPFLNFFVPVEEGGVAVDDEAGGCEVSRDLALVVIG